ncbi:intracellular ribonuclease LX-like isoform X2 [Olea europaea var. sylvestris]|uniref:intracellular ribonuclease LX-like isoform X2 n=1 Tax=Olea europaea var. sylvestris TaxID=158386 RepID=UPI000C1D16DE|nr:intracellular ribonuclease LX-like isoform X2 [Olea europaea var. sylvestris]
MMKVKNSTWIQLLVLQYLLILCALQDFDFFYFVQQWPASYCDSRHSCCYPKTGKPAEDFSIHGLWPNYNNGKWPSNCDRKNSFNQSEVSDLVSRMQKDWPTLACPSGDGFKFWSHEGDKHGTCTTLDQHTYFQSALDLKKKANLLQVLKNAGIQPGKFYSLESVKQAIEEGIGYAPSIECNVDSSGNNQLFQVYLCVNTSASNFIKCPVFPHERCGSEIEFPSFSDQLDSHDEL